MNFLALPVFLMDPAAATATIPSPAGSVESEGSQAANYEFLEMLLASEAAFQGTVPLEPQPPAEPEAITEVFEEAPVVPTTPTLAPEFVETESPNTQEAQDQVATAYAMVATMEVAPLPDTEVASSESPTRAIATIISKTDREPSEEEPKEIEELNVASSSLDRLEAVNIPTAIPIPVPTPVEVQHNRPILTEHVDVSEIKFVPSTPLSNAVFSDSPEVATRPSSDAPVILEALVTPKSAGAEVSPFHEPLVTQVDPQVAPQPRGIPAREAPSVQAPESLPMASETTLQRDPESSNPESGNSDDHSEPPMQEYTPAIDKGMPLANVVTTSPTVRPERPAITEPVRPPAPFVDEKPLYSERTPLKQMDVRIPDSNGDVTVRLQERAGSLHVSVRSNDSQIASGVANALPELTRALETEGFRSEAWTPQTNLGSDLRLDDTVGAVAFSRFEGPGVLQTEQSQTDDAQGERQSEPDWKEQQDKRRKRQTEEEFKENLW